MALNTAFDAQGFYLKPLFHPDRIMKEKYDRSIPISPFGSPFKIRSDAFKPSLQQLSDRLVISRKAGTWSGHREQIKAAADHAINNVWVRDSEN